MVTRTLSKPNISILFACLAGIGLCGCFHAENKFYGESDIVNDKHFEGHFHQPTNQDGVVPSLQIEKKADKHYLATYREGEQWVKLDAVLFRVGTNLFVDISRVSANGTPPNIAGPRPPNSFELLQMGTNGKTHSAFRIQLSEDAIETQIAFGMDVYFALEKDPALKRKLVGEAAVLLTDSTDKLRSFLAKIGSDDSVFSQKSKWVRTEKLPEK